MRRKDQKNITNRAPASTQPPRFWNIRNAADNVPVLEIFGDIGTSKTGDMWWGSEPGAGTFHEFAADLKKIGNVPELRVEIHSYGGSVTVGKGMHDKLLEHPANKTAVIYGICASAATYVALACQKVLIPANSFFLIHNSTGVCFGNSDDMQQCAEMLDIADESIANLYVARTGKTLEEIQDIMDRDTWMSGTEAVAIGLADEVIEPITITPERQAPPANFRPTMMNTMPAGARGWFDMSRHTNAQHVPTPEPMKLKPTPLLNAASETPIAGGAQPANATIANTATPAQPASQPSAAPVVAAPVVPAPVVPAPVNAVATPAPADLATMITNAVNAAVAPLRDEVTNLRAMNAAGVTGAVLGGAAAPATPAPNPAQNQPAQPVLNTMDPLRLINLGRRTASANGTTVQTPAGA